MKDIIIAFPSKSVAMKLRTMIESEGYHVGYVCALGSSVLSIAQDLHEGIVVCSSTLSDMNSSVLAENLPYGFDVISLSKSGGEDYMGNLINLTLPISSDELIEAIAVLMSTRSSFTHRSDDESQIIADAKLIIMKQNGMTESQAHKFLQKESMLSCKKLYQTAREIVDDFTE